MIGLSGAIVCAMSRALQSPVAAESKWVADANELVAAHAALPPMDLDVFILWLHQGGTPLRETPDPQTGLHGTYNPIIGPSAGVPPLPFLRFRRVEILQPSIRSSGSREGSDPGWAPVTTEYTDLFDDRREPSDQSQAFVPTYGHPPKNWLLCADDSILNRHDVRGGGATNGLTALGMSNRTLKGIAKTDANGNFYWWDQQRTRNNHLIEAIRAVNIHFGTATEVTEFKQVGLELGQVVNPDGTEENQATHIPAGLVRSNTIYGALARQLRRLAELS